MLRDEFIDSIRLQSANSGEFCCRAAAPEKYPQREFSSKIEVCLAEKVVPRNKEMALDELPGFRGSRFGEKVAKILLEISPKSPKSWRDVL